MNRLLTAALALFALGSASQAHAATGRLVIDADRPLQVMVDGHRMARVPGTDAVVIDGIYSAAHNVQITNARGNIAFLNTRLVVPPGHEMRCSYTHATRHLSCVDNRMAPPPPPPVASVAYAGPVMQASYTAAPPPVVPVGATVSTGGVTVTGPQGAGVSTGGVTVTTGGYVQQAPLPQKVKLVVRSLDGEWADVVVDGRVEAEMYNKAEVVIWVTPGVHTVEIREFMDSRPYTSQRLNTGYADTITLGIREGAPMTCYDHPEALYY